MNYELTEEELKSFVPDLKKIMKRKQKKERFKEKIFSKIGKYKKRNMYCSSEPEQVGSMNYLRYILVSDNTPDKMVDRLCGDGGKVPNKPDTKETLLKILKLLKDLHQEHRLGISSLPVGNLMGKLSEYELLTRGSRSPMQRWSDNYLNDIKHQKQLEELEGGENE